MPIVNSSQYTVRKTSLIRNISRLIKNEVIPLQDLKSATLTIGFVLDIHLIRAIEVNKMDFGKPEGIRVLLLNEKKVVSILDFYCSAKNIRFSNALVGDDVREFVSILNMMEKKYQPHKEPNELSYLHFFLSPSTYIMVSQPNGADYFKHNDKKVLKINKKILQSELKTFIQTRHPL